MKREQWLWGGGACAVVLLVGGMTYFLSREGAAPPNAASQSPQDKVRYALSNDFKALTPEKKAEYVKTAMGKDGPRALFQASRNLTDTERGELRQNLRPAMEELQNERVNKYFALPPEQRTAYLDQLIDEMRNRFQRDRQEGPPRDMRRDSGRADAQVAGAGGPGGRRGPSLSRMRDRIETTAPETRAKRAEFHRAMRARMIARGIQPQGPRSRR